MKRQIFKVPGFQSVRAPPRGVAELARNIGQEVRKPESGSEMTHSVEVTWGGTGKDNSTVEEVAPG